MRRPVRDYRLALEALGWLLLSRAALALLPFSTARRWMDVKVAGIPPAVEPPAVAWAIQAMARRLPGTHCLAKSLALNAMLRRAGRHSQVRIGVAAATAGEVDAHAWVVCGEQALDDKDLSRYVSFG